MRWDVCKKRMGGKEFVKEGQIYRWTYVNNKENKTFKQRQTHAQSLVNKEDNNIMDNTGEASIVFRTKKQMYLAQFKILARLVSLAKLVAESSWLRHKSGRVGGRGHLRATMGERMKLQNPNVSEYFISSSGDCRRSLKKNAEGTKRWEFVVSFFLPNALYVQLYRSTTRPSPSYTSTMNS